ncbi:MAG: protein kinase [Planctomycetota bacterium]
MISNERSQSTEPACLPRSVGGSSALPDLAGGRLAFEAGESLADRYIMQERIGFGTSGAVFRARDSVRDRDVAIKVFLPVAMADKRSKRRFLAEGRISTELSHPNIVNSYDVAESGPWMYVTMELLTGDTLRGELQKRQRSGRTYSADDTTEVVGQLANALAHAHQAVCHRDIKPENIFICDDGCPKILDFGLAVTLEDPTHTSSRSASSSLGYRAPESATDAKASPLQDQYSLACVAYEMLIGRPPVGAARPPHEIRQDVPRGLSRAIMRGLDPDPGSRFADMSEFAAAIRATAAPGSLRMKIVVAASALAAAAGITIGILALTPSNPGDPDKVPPPPFAQQLTSASELGRSAAALIQQAESYADDSFERSGIVDLATPAARLSFELERDWRLRAAAMLPAVDGWANRTALMAEFSASLGNTQRLDALITAQQGEKPSSSEQEVAIANIEETAAALSELSSRIKEVESIARYETAAAMLKRRIAPTIVSDGALASEAEDLLQLNEPVTVESRAVATSRIMQFIVVRMSETADSANAGMVAVSRAEAESQFEKLKELAALDAPGYDATAAAQSISALIRAAESAEQTADFAAANDAYQEAAAQAAQAFAQIRNVLAVRAVELATPTDEGVVPIIAGVRAGNEQLFALYRAGGGSLRVADAAGDTLLLASIEAGIDKVAALLIEAGVDVNIPHGEGRTPLSAAVATEQPTVARMLLEAGASTGWRSGNGQTLLDIAVERRNPDVASMLLDHGAELSAADPRTDTGRAALYQAAASNDASYIRMLHEIIGPIGDLSTHSGTVLFPAARSDAADAIEALIAAGANPNATGKDLDTALHVAARNGSLGAIRALLDAGADAAQRNKFDNTPSQVADAVDQSMATDLLRTHSTDG